MADGKNYGIYRLLKARMDLGHGGAEGQLFAYALYESRGVRICHLRATADGAAGLKGGIKSNWRDYTAFVDERGQDPGLAAGVQAILEDAGVYDLREENLPKLRDLERALSGWLGQRHEGENPVFLKIEGISTLEADELLSRFADGAESEDVSESAGDGGGAGSLHRREMANVVFNCSVVLDPVHGMPASTVDLGDMVTIAIPEDSPLYASLRAQQTDAPFDGTLTTPLTGVSESGSERLILEFNLSEGVSATAVAQKTLRIKAMKLSSDVAGLPFLSPPFLLFAGGVAVLLGLMAYLLMD